MERKRGGKMDEAMTRPVKVKGLSIGEGRPKLCVPIVADTIGAVSAQSARIAGFLAEHPGAVELVEWRADWMPSVEDEIGMTALEVIRAALPEMPLLFTFRTQKEGGEQAIAKEDYWKLACRMMGSGEIDLVDVELSMGDELLREAVLEAHGRGVKVVASNHDFHGTPSVQEMVSRMTRMEAMGADILKIAVMPQEPKDVLKLLSASVEMSRRSERPVITIAMSGMGAVSRICGEVFGSSITFGTVGESSAPGQMDVLEMKRMMEALSTGK